MGPAVIRTSKKLFSWSNTMFLVLCLVVMYIIFHNVAQLKEIKVLFEKMDDRWIVLALAAQVITYFCTAGTYYLLLNKFKGTAQVKFGDLFKLSIVSMFINQVVPSGGIGGNGFLFNEVTKRGVTQKKAWFTIVMECISLYVALALLLIVLPLLYALAHHGLPRFFLAVVIFGFLLYGFLAWLMTILSTKETLQRMLKKVSRIQFLKHFIEGIVFSPQGTFDDHATAGPWGIFLKYKKASGALIALQLGVFFADALTLLALLQGLHIHTPFLVIVLGLILTFVAAAIPLSPGSLLLYESAMTFFYTSMGMPFQAALIVTLLYRVLSFWIPIVLGLGLYKHVQKEEL